MPEGSPKRPPSPFGVAAGWWPVEFGEEVTDKPVAVRLGNRELVLYRDLTGTVRAVNDRCPHRRLPLSMGRLTDKGDIQCGYHGWCFDGATGQCTGIPNFRADEKVSPSIRVSVFATAENLAHRLVPGRTSSNGSSQDAESPDSELSITNEDLPKEPVLALFEVAATDGLIHVWTGGPEDPHTEAPTANVDSSAEVPTIRGVIEVRSPHESVAEALLLNPGRALGLSALLGGGYELFEPEVELRDGVVVVRRERLTLDLPRRPTYEPFSDRTTRVLISTQPDTGMTRIVSETSDGKAGYRLVVGVTPLGQIRAAVRWRCQILGKNAAAIKMACSVAGRLRRLANRTGDALEELADSMEVSIDPAVLQLRELRLAHAAAEGAGV